MSEVSIARKIEVPFGGRSCRDSAGRHCFMLDTNDGICRAALFEQNPQSEEIFADAYVTRRRSTVATPDNIPGGCPNGYTQADLEALGS